MSFFDMWSTRLGHGRRWISMLFPLCLTVMMTGSSCSSHSESNRVRQAEPGTSEPARERPLIGVIEAGGTSRFQAAVREGMQAGAQESGIDLQWFTCGSRDEAELLKQISLAAEQDLDGVCVHPFVSSEAVVAALQNLSRDHRPIFVFGQSVSGADFASGYVGADHFYAGRRIAEELIERFEDGAVVIVAAAPPDNANAATRQRGFQFALDEGERDLQLQQIGRESEAPDERAQAILEAIREAGEAMRIVVAFTPSSTKAIVDLIDNQLRLGGDVEVIGFGSYAGILDDLRERRLLATLVEDPYVMGLSTIIAVTAEVDGRSSGEFISSGEHFIAAEQVSDPAIVKLLEANKR